MRKRNGKKREIRMGYLTQALATAENAIADMLQVERSIMTDSIRDTDVFLIGQDGCVQSRRCNVPSQDISPEFDWGEVGSCLDPASGELEPLRAKRKRQQLLSIIHHIEYLMQVSSNPHPRVVDFGAGSGHLGLLVASRNPQCHVTLVERKAYSLRVAEERIQSTGLCNVSIFHDDASTLVRETGPFDIGVSMHSCGQLTDLAMELCVAARASFVVTPCCYGQISKPPPSFIPDDYPEPRDTMGGGLRAKGQTTPPPVPLTHFRSLSAPSDMFYAVTSGADYTICFEDISDDELLTRPSAVVEAYLLAKRCMRVVDFDRAIGILSKSSCPYEFHLSTLKPITCSPKNDVIVATCLGVGSRQSQEKQLLFDYLELEAHVRETTRRIPGPCTLDLSAQNVYRFSGYSSFSCTMNEFKQTLPEWLCRRIEKCCAYFGVHDAFAVRRELVSFKKLCLHLYHRVQKTDHTLRQYSSLFFCDIVTTPVDSPEHQRYSKLCGATMLCKGYLRVLLDMRHFCKLVTSIPRHRDIDAVGYAADLLSMPNSLGSYQLMKKAADWCGLELSAQTSRPDDVLAELLAGGLCRVDGQEEYAALLEAIRSIGRGAVDGGDGNALPPHYLSYVDKCLIGRGVLKSIRIRSCLRRLSRAIDEVCRNTRETLAVFTPTHNCRYEFVRETVPLSTVKDRIHCDMHGNILQGMLPALDSCRHAMTMLLQSTAGQAPHFIASDAAIVYVPSSGSCSRNAPLLDLWSSTDSSAGIDGLLHMPAVVQRVLDEAYGDYQLLLSSPQWVWPPPTVREGSGRYMKVKASSRCNICQELFAKIWVRSSVVAGDVYVCMQCEKNCHAQGLCPWSQQDCDVARKVVKSKCPGKSLWCPHQGRCLVCERGGPSVGDGGGIEASCVSTVDYEDGCMKCLFLRGSSEVAWNVCNKMLEGSSNVTLRYLFLDFDGTLTTTRRGRSPLEQSAKHEHVVDTYMRELCTNSNLSVHLITRNSHLEDIKTFLVQEGCCTMESAVQVHCVKKKTGRGKWDVIHDVLAGDGKAIEHKDKGPLAIFVDDTLDELMHTEHKGCDTTTDSDRVLRFHYVAL